MNSGRHGDFDVRPQRIADKVSRAVDRVVGVTAPRSDVQARASLHGNRHATDHGPPFHCRRLEANRRVEHDVAEARARLEKTRYSAYARVCRPNVRPMFVTAIFITDYET